MRGLISQLVFLIVAPFYGVASFCDFMPSFGSLLYNAPEIVQPTDGATKTIDKVTIEWKPATSKNAFTKPFLRVQSYKVRITSPDPDVTYNYETINLEYTVHTIKSPGVHTATVASVGFFGDSDWSSPVEFNVIIPKQPEAPKLQPPTAPPGPKSPPAEKEARPKVYNTKLSITSPLNGAKLPINNLVFKWTTVPEAHYYKLWIEEKDSLSDKLTYEYARTGQSCNTCGVEGAGKHKAKVMAIGPFGTGTWSEEVEFEITQKTKPPRINKPVKDEVVKDEINFEWSEIPDAKSYQLNVVGPSGEKYDFEPPFGHYKVKMLRNSGAYAAKVAAMGPYGLSDWSRIVPFRVMISGEVAVTREPVDMNFDPVAGNWMNDTCKIFHIENVPDSDYRPKVEAVVKKTNNMGGKKGFNIDRDKDSFFASISHVMTNSVSHKGQIRFFVCQQIAKLSWRYLAGQMSAEPYFATSSMRTGEAATRIEIAAAADMLETTIWVRDLPGASGWWTEFRPSEKTHTESIFLIYENYNSYYYPVYTWS